MKLHYDPDADALYLRLTDAKPVDSEEVQPGLILDFNALGEVIAIEILNLSKKTNTPGKPLSLDLNGILPELRP